MLLNIHCFPPKNNYVPKVGGPGAYTIKNMTKIINVVNGKNEDPHMFKLFFFSNLEAYKFYSCISPSGYI